MNHAFLIRTSKAGSENPELEMITEPTSSLNIPFMVVGANEMSLLQEWLSNAKCLWKRI